MMLKPGIPLGLGGLFLIPDVENTLCLERDLEKRGGGIFDAGGAAANGAAGAGGSSGGIDV